MVARRSLLVVLPALFLVAACGNDSGSVGALHQDSISSGPDGLGGDVAGDVAGDTTALDDVATTDSVATDTAAGDTAAGDTATSDTAQDTTPSGPTLTIRVEGALEDRSPADGLAAQTPTTWVYGLQRLELLRSADDPNPEVIFDYAPSFVLVDLLSTNVVAQVPIADLPTGTFPYFRIVLTHEEVVVASSLHQVPVIGDYATPLDIVYALSNVDSDGLAMQQGDVTVTANIFGTNYAVPTHWAVPTTSPAPGAGAAAVDGEWRVTFPVSPSLVSATSPAVDVTYAVRFYVTNAFRWQDQATPGYTTDAWDISLGPPATFEPVLRIGANAYEVYYQGP